MTDRIRFRVRDAMHSSHPGPTQAKMAKDTGMNKDALSRALNGQRNFSASELAALAKTLKVSLSWLITGDPGPDGSTAPHSIQSPGRIDRLAQAMAFPAGAYREVGLSTSAVTSIGDGISAEHAARMVARKLSTALGPRFVDDLAGAVEGAFGIGVFVVAEGPAFDARAMSDANVTYIVVRATGAWYQANLVLARELGELLAERHTDLAVRGHATELWARRFAMELLLPEARLRSIDFNRQTPRELATFLWDAGVSAKALARRLSSLGIHRGPAMVHADEGTLQLLVWQDPDCLSHRRAGAFRAPRIPADLYAAHLTAMRQGLVDGTSLAWMLDTPLTEL